VTTLRGANPSVFSDETTVINYYRTDPPMKLSEFIGIHTAFDNASYHYSSGLPRASQHIAYCIGCGRKKTSNKSPSPSIENESEPFMEKFGAHRWPNSSNRCYRDKKADCPNRQPALRSSA